MNTRNPSDGRKTFAKGDGKPQIKTWYVVAEVSATEPNNMDDLKGRQHKSLKELITDLEYYATVLLMSYGSVSLPALLYVLLTHKPITINLPAPWDWLRLIEVQITDAPIQLVFVLACLVVYILLIGLSQYWARLVTKRLVRRGIHVTSDGRRALQMVPILILVVAIIGVSIFLLWGGSGSALS